MSEHQIVITLKPEQFLRVQKLAGAAGARSIEIFVQQQLLAALQIESDFSSNNPDMNLAPIVTELKRLHGELRDIVADSLVTSSVEFSLNDSSAAASLELQEGLPIATEDLQNQSKDPEPSAIKARKDQAIDPEHSASGNRKDQANDPEPFATKNSKHQSKDHEPLDPINNEEREKTRKRKAAEAKPIIQEQAPESLPLLMPANASWTIPAMSADEFLKSAATALNVETNKQDDRDPLSELLGTDLSSDKKPLAAAELDDDVPLSMLARHKKLASQQRTKDDKSGLSKPEPSPEKVLDGPAAAIEETKPDKPDINKKSEEQNQKTASQTDKKKENKAEREKAPKTASRHGGSDFLANYRPLDNPDEGSPFSGGPPPKRGE